MIESSSRILLALLVMLMLGAQNTALASDGMINRGHSLSNSFTVLAYNIYMRPAVLFRDDQAERGEVLPSKLSGFDVIVFSEAFDDTVRDRLMTDLREEYPYRTGILGADRGLKQDGGVIIVSRWPIAVEAQRLYGDVCIGGDCWADKGVLYARFEKHGRSYHVFASHMQSGREKKHRQTRLRQLQAIKSFIDSYDIPGNEPVLIAGDLNVDKYDEDEYREMLHVLDAWQPVASGHPYTVDSAINRRASFRLYLDYVLVSRRHLQPADATIETLIPRSRTPFGIFRTNQELSDHFPVSGNFTFPSSTRAIAATRD